MRSRLLALTSLVAIMGAGCSAPAVPGGSTAGSGAAPSRVASGSGCAHPYYPLMNGYEVAFKSTVPRVADSTFTIKVTEASGDKATLTYEFSKPGGTADDTALKMTQDLDCSGGKISAKGQLDMSAMSGMQMTSKTKKASGELLPKDLAVGSEWDNEFQVETQTTNPDAIRLGMGNVSSTMTTHYKAVREESVTVPAGTYTALVVESDMKTQMGLPGMAGRAPVTVKTTSWWVKGMGMVKSVTGTSLMEATTVTLP